LIVVATQVRQVLKEYVRATEVVEEDDEEVRGRWWCWRPW
jgi:hypothetical protein